MLEYRQQMEEGVPFAHIHYRIKLDAIWAMELDERRLAMGVI